MSGYIARVEPSIDHFRITPSLDYAHHDEMADRIRANDWEATPLGRKILLVHDNLNTHAPASFYKAFAPAEARRTVERFEWRYTQKHGSCSIWWSQNWRFSLASVSTGASITIPHDRSHRMDDTAQHPQRQGHLALHNCRRPLQAEKSVPSTLKVSGR